MRKLEGLPVSKDIDRATLAVRRGLNETPTLNIGRVGDNPDDIAYENAILRKAKALDVNVSRLLTSETEDGLNAVKQFIERRGWYNEAVMLMCPESVRDDMHVLTSVDVEGLHPLSDYYPCTPEAVTRILDHYEIPIEGKNVVIVNRSKVVGRPLADMLLDRGATVTVCHSKTRNLLNHTRGADIVITAMGKPGFFDMELSFYHTATVIDLGMGLDEDGKVRGDVDLSKVNIANYADWKDVGAVATSILFENTVDVAKRAEEF